jgi:hypothetical protein
MAVSLPAQQLRQALAAQLAAAGPAAASSAGAPSARRLVRTVARFSDRVTQEDIDSALTQARYHR